MVPCDLSRYNLFSFLQNLKSAFHPGLHFYHRMAPIKLIFNCLKQNLLRYLKWAFCAKIPNGLGCSIFYSLSFSLKCFRLNSFPINLINKSEVDRKNWFDKLRFCVEKFFSYVCAFEEQHFFKLNKNYIRHNPYTKS